MAMLINSTCGRQEKRQNATARILISAATCCSLIAPASGFHAAGTPVAASILRRCAFSGDCGRATRLARAFPARQAGIVEASNRSRGKARGGVVSFVADAEDMEEQEMRVHGAGKKMLPAWNARQPTFPVSYTPVATIVAASVVHDEKQQDQVVEEEEEEKEERWDNPITVHQSPTGTTTPPPLLVPHSQLRDAAAPVHSTPPPVRMELPSSVELRQSVSRAAKPSTRYDADEQAVKLLHAKAMRAALQAARVRKLAEEKRNGGLPLFLVSSL